MFRKQDVLIAVFIVLLAVVLVVFLVGESNKSRKLSELSTEIELKTSEYQSEKNKLTEQLAELKKQGKIERAFTSGFVPIFVDPSYSLIEDVLPVMTDNNISGVVCITENEIPTVGETFTEYDLQTLIDHGWEFAMYWDGNTQIKDWYFNTTRLMSEVGVEIPSILYLDSEDLRFVSSVDLVSMGFEHIIAFSSEGKEFDASMSDFSVITSYAWNSEEGNNRFNYKVTSDVTYSFTFDSDSVDKEFDYFKDMCFAVSKKMDKGYYFAGSPEYIIQRRLELSEKYDMDEDEYIQKIAKLEEEIEKINRKIDNIYLEHINGES